MNWLGQVIDRFAWLQQGSQLKPIHKTHFKENKTGFMTAKGMFYVLELRVAKMCQALHERRIEKFLLKMQNAAAKHHLTSMKAI
jgi:hypothetical protein